MRRRFWILLHFVFLLYVAVSRDLDAQEGYELRYASRELIRIRTITRSDILMTVTHEPRGADTLSVEATRLEGMTQFFDADAGGRFLVELHYDSLRARLRPVGGTWRDLEPAEGELGVVRAVVGEKLDVIEAEFVEMPHLQETKAQMARALGGGLVLTLPDGPQVPGGSWTADLRYPLNALAEIGREDGAPAKGELLSQPMVMLDSVVKRSADTLYYLTLSGGFVPSTMTSSLGSETASVTVGGSMAAMMVWSSGWSAFVSGATRAVIVMDVRSGSADDSTVSHLRFEITTRSQVRM